MKKVITITAIALLAIAPTAQAGWFSANPEECIQSKVVQEAIDNKVTEDAIGNKVTEDAIGNKVTEDAAGNKIVEDAAGNKLLSCGFSLMKWFE